MTGKGKKIWGCTLGNCIHVAGIYHFFRFAQECGYATFFAGAGLGVDEIIAAIRESMPDFVALSYRLTPEVASEIFRNLKTRFEHEKLTGFTWLFGGTPPVCQKAKETGIFSAIFSGEESDDQVIRWLKGDKTADKTIHWGDTLLDRIKSQAPFPILRHHFGLPGLEETIRGVEAIALAKATDVISIGPDQNAQEFFFRPQEMDQTQNGAGGVPLRKPEDLRRIYDASRCGNYPLLRIYSGTQDLLPWAALSVKELHNAWAAIPLYWYSSMDGRSRRSIQNAIAENQQTMSWYAAQDIPVEVNEAHHWSLRGAPDEVAVAAAYLAAYNAKAMRVKDFVLQLMWNTPPQILPFADLGKMLAKLQIVESLAGKDFRIWLEVRAGLVSLSPEMNTAKGQLAASTMFSMQVNPHIVHVVGYCEGDHAAAPAEVIESCRIVRGVIKNCLSGSPDMKKDKHVQRRKNELLKQAERIVEKIRALSRSGDALTDPEVLALAVEKRIMFAPQMIRNLD